MVKNVFIGAGLALCGVVGVCHAQTVIKLKPEAVAPKAAPKPSQKEVAAKLADAQSAARKAITAQYTSVANSTMRGNLPGIMKVISPDFQYFDTTGHVTDRVGYERLQYETLRTSTKVRYSYTIKSLMWRGGDAIVRVESRFQGVYNWKKFDVRTTSRDYWSPTSRGWMVRQRVDNDIRGFFNGVNVNYNPIFGPPVQPQAPTQSQGGTQPKTGTRTQGGTQSPGGTQPQAPTQPEQPAPPQPQLPGQPAEGSIS